MSGDFVGFEFGEKTNTSKINPDNGDAYTSTETSCVDNSAIATKDNNKVGTFKH